jgi:cell pole-organizing protein PopZ
MADNKPPPEPSMDEILASIRQIISDDSKDDTSPPVKPSAKEDTEDILDLTDLLPEESSFFTKKEASLAGQPLPSNLRGERLESLPPESHQHPPVRSEKPFEDPLISHSTASEAAQTLARLTQEKKRTSKSPLPQQGSSQAIEDLVRELLRPLLREWLDANLSRLVHDVVSAEVEKIVRQSEEGSSTKRDR